MGEEGVGKAEGAGEGSLGGWRIRGTDLVHNLYGGAEGKTWQWRTGWTVFRTRGHIYEEDGFAS